MSYEPPYKFVEIIWDDAASNSRTWVEIADVAAPAPVITRGWLVKDEPKFVSVASSVAYEELEIDNVGNTMTVPRGMIVTMRELKVTTRKPKPVKSEKDR